MNQVFASKVSAGSIWSYRFPAHNLNDGIAGTHWLSRRSGEHVTFFFPATLHVKQIYILNAYNPATFYEVYDDKGFRITFGTHKYEKHWSANLTVDFYSKSVRFYFQSTDRSV